MNRARIERHALYNTVVLDGWLKVNFFLKKHALLFAEQINKEVRDDIQSTVPNLGRRRPFH